MSGASLRSACEKGLDFQVQRIINGARDVSGMRSPIGTGIQHPMGRKELLEILNDRDSKNNAAIHVCCMMNRHSCLQLLLETGLCDINLLGQSGFSAACYCAHLGDGREKCLQLLLEFSDKSGKDFDLDQSKMWGHNSSLLHVASSRGHLELVKVLLDRNADTSRQDDDGNTPLHLAAIENHVEVAKLLIAQCRNKPLLDLQNRNYSTPYECCISDECRNVFQMC